MADKKVRRHKRTKGVVLFTVVAIMFMLLIMIMATLAVVSSANRRTYTKFKENQAYFTARSGIETFMDAVSNMTDGGTNDDLYNDFKKFCEEGSIVKPEAVPTIDDLKNNSNVMKAEITFPQPDQDSGDLKYLFGTCDIYAHKTSDYTGRIIANVKLADCESTVYLYIQWDPPKPELFKNAMTSFSNVSNSTMAVLGGVSANIDPANTAKSDASKAEASTIRFRNNGFVSRNSAFGSGLTIRTQTKFVFQDVVGKKGESGAYSETAPDYMGLTVLGDLSITNTPTFYADCSHDNSKRPYIFTNGRLDISTDPQLGTNYSNGSVSDDNDHKMNIYCNTINLGNSGFTLNGDIYIYNESEDSNYAYMTSDGQSGSNKITGTIYGNVYCDGDLFIDNSAKIYGDVYCSGTLSYQNLGESGISGKLYAGTFSPIGTNSPFQNGSDNEKMAKFSSMPNSDTYADKTWVIDNIAADPEKLHGNYGGQNQDGKPLNDGSIYPAFGYYVNDAGAWTPRTEPDPSWAVWDPSKDFPMNTSNKTVYIDATTANQSIVVPNGFFSNNTSNNKIVIQGDKRVDFYIVGGKNGAGNPTGEASSSNQNNASKNMVITEEMYTKMMNGDQIHLSCPGETDNLSLNVYYFVEDGITYNIEGDFLMGYIYAPKSTVNMNKGPSVNNINYDGTSYGNVNDLQFIGSVVSQDISTSNDVMGIFLPPKSDDDMKDPHQFWQNLYYSNH